MTPKEVTQAGALGRIALATHEIATLVDALDERIALAEQLPECSSQTPAAPPTLEASLRNDGVALWPTTQALVTQAPCSHDTWIVVRHS